ELGDLTSAAEVLAALEASPLAREPMAFPLLMRARVMLLEYARRAPSLPPEVQATLRLVALRAEEVQLKKKKTPWITYILIALNVIAFAASGDETGSLARAGALFRPAVEAGEWWRLVSAMFLHGGVLHLGMNMYGLYI